MTNTQQPESFAKGDGQTLDVHSIFYTLQGEGPLSGMPAVFIRLAGCNLMCPGCDTEYTQGRSTMDLNQIVKEVERLDGGEHLSAVVITGGEPLRQPIGPLVDVLLFTRRTVQIESNGTCGPDSILHDHLRAERPELHLVISPKTKRVHPLCHELATAFKYVLDLEHVDPNDGLPTVALDHEVGKGVARPRPGAPVYLNPMDDKDERLNRLNRLAVGASCLKHGHRAGLQVHKYLELA